MQLSKQTIKTISRKSGLEIPDERLLNLPERVLQFGTGVLLRGLPDYFIDQANRKGIFNGRVVVVKSTSTGGADAFDHQDGLYTLCIRGIENGQNVDRSVIHSSISRVISAHEGWSSILECAHNPEIQVIISNTTEAGIVLEEDDIRATPPRSFPGKLLAFLYERYKAFAGKEDSGMVIIPTELLVNNADKLKSIVLELAAMNKLEQRFVEWLNNSNEFCNSLVDRIVPGKLSAKDRAQHENQFGYNDELIIMAESFRLWAIESKSEKVKKILSFVPADEGVVVADNIEKFRELKLRLLNGTHTFSCGLAFFSGFETVKLAMQDPEFASFIRRLSIQEIAPLVSGDIISYEEACKYAESVIERFSNPFLEHQWISITLQYSLKMKMRNVPLLQRHYSKTTEAPECMTLGFAAYILFMKCEQDADGKYQGSYKGKTYPVQDDFAEWFAVQWQQGDPETIVRATLANQDLWGMDLSSFPGFEAAVLDNLSILINKGAIGALEKLNRKEKA
jgi:tagaturonate reductase